ncbi:uncharacterized protein LOC100114312 [Nasonia vitripennis]|uniref:No-mechanoreceptor potential A n=1 Tax=Nasonia vitripennis TaxID=7425 RepID=A0A7M7H555_NASVI|nr:uncharacterized protein LOC100114312 [Nasonia vitripennis]
MKKIHNMFSMVQAITVLTVLKMLVNAQTTCNGGAGRVVYERLPDQQLQGFDDEVVRDSAPPFRVLEKCQELCLRDRTATNNLVRACSSFDFQPGTRIASFSGAAEYEESTCYLSAEQAQPEGIGNLMMVPNSVHFTEVCLASSRIERECPNRRYVFERHSRKKLKLPATDVKEVTAANRTECEDRCLNEFSFVCRSATYDVTLRSCSLSRFTRRTHPELLEDNANSEYLENTCLNAEHRCDGLAVFIKEENKRLRGPFEVDIYTNLTLDECQALCLRAEKYFCRSVEFDEQTRQCVISEEDSVSQRDDIGISNSPSYHFYDLVCLDNPRGSEYPDNSVSSHLFSDGRRPDTAFQRFRNSRLSGEFHSEITGRSLSECLDECLRQTSFQCRSAVYSEHFRTCRLSRFNQKDGHRIIYDADYDYYENLMHQYLDGDGGSGYRPDPLGQDTKHGRPFLGRPGYPEDYPGGNKVDRFPDKYPFPGSRYPLHYLPGDERYPPAGSRPHYPPPGPDRYPMDRYPDDRYPGGDRYPVVNRYPMDRYPAGDRYPMGDRYPIGDRYPTTDDRYPMRPISGRYPSRPPPVRPGGGNRFPGVIHRYPVVTSLDRPAGYPGPSRFPVGTTGFPAVDDRYPPPPPATPLDRYPLPDDPVDRYPPGGLDGNRLPERYPVSDRYPEKDGYPYGDRYPGYTGKDYGERPIHTGSPYGPARPGIGGPGGSGGSIAPLPGNSLGPGGYDEGGIVGGGYIGEGGVYHSRPFGTSGGPIIGRPPLLSRCDEQENFRQVGQGTRVRKPFVRRYTTASSLSQCERECADARDFVCRSFNFRPYAALYGAERDNCELSDRDSRDMDMGNPIYYDTGSDYDFYERNNGRQGVDECLDVSQVCNEDGMEFTLRTPEGFIGRIYTHGYYDRCFFRGNGGTVNVLRISGAQGYPECGTQRYGDTMTNIVVVQFSDYVQTGRDKRFNLTCLFRGPDEAVVTSGYIGAGRSGSPIPIEYLPAENTLSSRVRLLILYQGRPTTTIAVGDPLTFRLEAQDGSNYATDIFATNVVARDPYSGRSVQLIDRYGCPVDNYVFPGLDRLRDGDSLEARFNAFKIPESNFLVFEATVRTCREGCQPAFCSSGTGRSEPSYGRKRRSISNETEIEDNSNSTSANLTDVSESNVNGTDAEVKDASEAEEEFVREMIEVFDSRYDMTDQTEEEEDNTIAEKRIAPVIDSVCITPNEYYGLITAVVVLVVILASIVLLTVLIYRKYVYAVIVKNRRADRSSNHSRNSDDTYSTRANNFSFLRSGLQNPSRSSPTARSLSNMINQRSASSATLAGIAGTSSNHRTNFDPSEPIYTDPSLFEVSRCSLVESKGSQNDNFHLM